MNRENVVVKLTTDHFSKWEYGLIDYDQNTLTINNKKYRVSDIQNEKYSYSGMITLPIGQAIIEFRK